MIRYDRFPEGKTHAAAFSFDDGRIEDLRLAALLDRYSLKATFHLNSGRLDTEGHLSVSQACELSRSHEVALHGENHARLVNCPPPTVVREVFMDRLFLEEKTERIISGFSYPYGDINDPILNAVSACGIRYARTTNSTHRFELPKDFLQWDPTCHMYDAYHLVPRFMEKLLKLGQSPLFLVWGHSFELERDDRWNETEAFFRELSNREDVWYATCGEICSYMEAVRRIRVSVDETMVENPSFSSVWISCDKTPLEIRGGECIKLR